MTTCWAKLPPSELLEKAPEILNQLEADSPFFQSNPPRQFPCFKRSELGLGSVLGEGAFSRVNEILATRLETTSSSQITEKSPTVVVSSVPEDVAEGPNSQGNEEGAFDDLSAYDEVDGIFDEEESRQFIGAHCLRHNVQGSKESRYAIKRLLPDLSDSDRAKGIVDLAIESKFLSSLFHPNIIKMRAQASGSLTEPGFFIILDRLYGTLDDRIDGWKEEKKTFSGSCFGLCSVNKMELKEVVMEQLLVLYDLSAAMRHMHEHNIVYRDIKPENIGFDVRGDVKIFDFGLAKELVSKDLEKDGLYNVTGRTGSRLYMAPEVALCKPYNLKADVYSFGILIWEVISLKVPFKNFTFKEVYERVVVGGLRPTLSVSWSSSVKKLVRSCWSESISKRPSFENIAEILRAEMASFPGTLNDSIMNRTSHMMNRSNSSRHRKTMDGSMSNRKKSKALLSRSQHS